MTESGWVRVIDFPSEAEASQAGATLLESGIVALAEDDAGITSLAVQADDVERACEVLGVAAPAPEVLPLEVPLGREQVRWRFPRERLGLFIIGYVVALAVLATGVFFLVVWLLGGYDSTEIPDLTVPPS